MNCCKNQDPNHDGRKDRRTHGGLSHLWMMALCCGAPLILLFVVSLMGASFPAVRAFLVSILPFLCPVMMAAMIPMMFLHGKRGNEDNRGSPEQGAKEEDRLDEKR